jgi:heme exporter protein D
MNLGPHVGFIVSAYVAAIVIVAGLVAWIAFERWHLTRVLNEFEAHGIRRRSGRPQEDKA